MTNPTQHILGLTNLFSGAKLDASLLESVTQGLASGQAIPDLTNLVFGALPEALQSSSVLGEIEKFLNSAVVQMSQMKLAGSMSGSLKDDGETKLGAYKIAGSLDGTSGVSTQIEGSVIDATDDESKANMKFLNVACDAHADVSGVGATCKASLVRTKIVSEDPQGWSLELRGLNAGVGTNVPNYTLVNTVMDKIKNKPVDEKKSKQPKTQDKPADGSKLNAGKTLKLSLFEAKLKLPTIQLGDCDYDVLLTASALAKGVKYNFTDRSAEIFVGGGPVGGGIKLESSCSVL